MVQASTVQVMSLLNLTAHGKILFGYARVIIVSFLISIFTCQCQSDTKQNQMHLVWFCFALSKLNVIYFSLSINQMKLISGIQFNLVVNQHLHLYRESWSWSPISTLTGPGKTPCVLTAVPKIRRTNANYSVKFVIVL